MNRIDRLFAILLHLQYKESVRAQDLADKFEVSKRIIYRDIVALSQSGVPIVAMPGEGYSLVEGFYLPSLVFTPTEAGALVLSTRMLLQQAEGSFLSDAKDALEKLLAVLPTDTRREVEQLVSLIQFITPEARFNLDDARLTTLRQAIQSQRVVHLRYHSFRENASTEREIEPHRLYYAEGNWYVTAFCRLRKDVRTFRLARIEALSLQAESFTWVISTKPQEDEQMVEIRIRFANDVVRWVYERQHYAFCGEETTLDGIVMTYQASDPLELKYWVLGWGASAEVLSPPQLRAEIRQEAKTLINMLT